MDKNGDRIEELRIWDVAIPFNFRGFAKVSNSGGEFLLDTMGKVYPLATSIVNLNECIRFSITRF